MSLTQVGPGEDVVNVEGDGGAKEKELLGSRARSECGWLMCNDGVNKLAQ